MKHSNPPLTLVVRRFAHENVELLPVKPPATPVSDPSAAGCRISAHTDGDTQVYAIALPESLLIRPVDWRRFSYDHAKVAELLTLCVRDNLALCFAAWSDKERARVEGVLTQALGDLSSVFDLASVRCESPEPGRLLCTIEGSHKNGLRNNYHVEVAL